MNYAPAINPHPVQLGQDGCHRFVLRSHPDFPHTLAPETERQVHGTNPSWPEASVEWVLDRLEPPCHADWEASKPPKTEEVDGHTAYVILVRPGAREK